MQNHLTIANFRFGLDSRRSQMTAQPGTLVRAENGHVNQGGEFEKRRAFSVFGTGTGLMWLEATSAGLVAFYDSLTAPVVPAGVTGIMLTHPAVTEGVVADAAKHKLDAILSSTAFNGNVFCIAKFKDGLRFLYYNGTVVAHSRNGRILDGLNANADLATDLAAEVTALGGGWVGTAVGAYVDIKSPVGETGVTIVADTNDGVGTISVQHIAGALDPVPGVGAVTTFAISNVHAGETVTIVLPNDVGAAAATINVTEVAADASGNQTATDIAAAINATVCTPQYTATASGNQVTVVGLPGDTNLNAKNVAVTVDAGATIGAGSPVVVASPDYLEKIVNSTVGGVVTSPSTTATPSSAATAYLWEYVSGSTAISATNGTSATTAFKAFVARGGSEVGVWRCKATIGGNPVYSNNVSIDLERNTGL